MVTFGLEQMTFRERDIGVGPVADHLDGPGGTEVSMHDYEYTLLLLMYLQF